MRRSFVIQPRLHSPSHKVASLPVCGLDTLPPALEGKETNHLELPSNASLYAHCISITLLPNTRSTRTHLLAPGRVYREQGSLRRQVFVELPIPTFDTERCGVYKSFCRSHFLRGYIKPIPASCFLIRRETRRK